MKNYNNTDNNQNIDLIGKSILVCEDSIPEDLFLSAHFSTWLPYSIGNSAKKQFMILIKPRACDFLEVIETPMEEAALSK